METISSFKKEYEFLSNVYKCRNCVEFEGSRYSSVTSALAAARTLDPNMRQNIKLMPPALVTKELERILREKIMLNPEWSETYEIELMKNFVYQKFANNLVLKRLLIETYPMHIEETNVIHDNRWGKCVCGRCPITKQLAEAMQNQFGKILMDTRERLMENR